MFIMVFDVKNFVESPNEEQHGMPMKFELLVLVKYCNFEVRPTLKKAGILSSVANHFVEEKHLDESIFQLLTDEKSESIQLRKWK